MQLRLQRLLTDRTLMLGAISHDLGTPLTRLRLRVETDRAVDEKQKMLDDIESMESMLASSLSFVRGVDDAEPHDAVDLASLLQTACDMVSDLGGDVEYAGAARCRYHCKPQALLRALTNVIMNAAKYGRCARVTLARLPGAGFVVDVEDVGPGIAEAEKSRVFEPFYRTESARDSDSRGMGLGLAIARSVILGHGGTDRGNARPRAARPARAHRAARGCRLKRPYSSSMVSVSTALRRAMKSSIASSCAGSMLGSWYSASIFFHTRLARCSAVRLPSSVHCSYEE